MAYTTTLSCVLGSRSANSYVDIDTATEYLRQRHGGSAWFEIEGDRSPEKTEELRDQLLITASRMIDSLTFRYGKFFAYERGFSWRQSLKFPWADHRYQTHQATTGTESTITVVDLAGMEIFHPNDFFVGGSVHLRGGASALEARSVSAFDSQTGTLTVSQDFPEAIDGGTEFFLLWPIETAVEQAVIEQAYHLLLENPAARPSQLNARVELIASGVSSYSVDGLAESFAAGGQPGSNGGSMLCHAARLLLRPYIQQSLSVGRS